MLQWQKDNKLAGIRDAAALAKLPADDQKSFGQLWADVAVLRKGAGRKADTALPEKPAQKTDAEMLAAIAKQAEEHLRRQARPGCAAPRRSLDWQEGPTRT